MRVTLGYSYLPLTSKIHGDAFQLTINNLVHKIVSQAKWLGFGQ